MRKHPLFDKTKPDGRILMIPKDTSRCSAYVGPVWQGSGSSKNGSGSGSSCGVASLVELSHFKKRLAK
jgi:hypothetical protein